MAREQLTAARSALQPFVHCAANGWNEPTMTDAAVSASGGYAQIATFAKFGQFPDSGPSSGIQRMPGDSPELKLFET